MKGRKILLGVTGSVAAYKAPDVARRLLDAGAEVRAVLTAGGQKFIPALTLAAVTGRPAAVDAFDLSDGGMPHLDLAHWADAVLVAPASANALSRFAAGSAGDLLSAILLATRAPVFLAPAMHEPMWTHPATRRNIALLTADGRRFLGPVDGALASGDRGAGRMMEPADLVRELGKALS